ncbi:MAG: hypothetical protein Q9219_004278 [cf. Caloplaca sp. 3 TL-2023]
MLPEQASGTNPTASTTTFADPSSICFSPSEITSAIENLSQNYTEAPTEDNTNSGTPQIEQQKNQETQQQHNMARPGQNPTYDQNQSDEAALRAALRSALAAENLDTASLQSFDRMEMERPCTPPQQTNVGRYPYTPGTTPPVSVEATSKEMARSKTFDWSYEAMKPAPYLTPSQSMRRTASYPDNKTALDADLYRIMNCMSPSPSAASLPMPALAQFPDLSTLNMDFAMKGSQYNSSHYSPMSSVLSPLLSSFESSPEMTGMTLFDDLGGPSDLLLPTQATELSSSQSSHSIHAYPSSPKEKGHRRAQSAVSVDIDGTNEETGITEDEISAYITGPMQDSKYICTYEGCNKHFGRKENIRSHVQTHLGDRQWRCNHCNKRFVRQHDLKRHAKIHTGQKPHLCPCGNGFARHDALTRHRQRNTCIGGFGVAEGMPQSPSKRGRPKKRPDMETRRDKAAKTRARATEKARASSPSESSSFSAPSPEMFFEDLTMDPRGPDAMVTIQSQEGDEVLEAVNALSPEMVEDYFREMSKGSSPFSDFEEENLFGAEANPFGLEATLDSTSQWLL